MTARHMVPLLGKKGRLHIERLVVHVEIIDGRTNFGRVEYRVRPLAGAQNQWVDAKRVDVEKGN